MTALRSHGLLIEISPQEPVFKPFESWLNKTLLIAAKLSRILEFRIAIKIPFRSSADLNLAKDAVASMLTRHAHIDRFENYCFRRFPPLYTRIIIIITFEA